MQGDWSSIAGVNHGQGARNSSCKGSGVAKLGLIMGRINPRARNSSCKGSGVA